MTFADYLRIYQIVGLIVYTAAAIIAACRHVTFGPGMVTCVLVGALWPFFMVYALMAALWYDFFGEAYVGKN